MINQRKRVAKRLASGLLAGAVAFGGLAISGLSVNAQTPTSLSTNRLQGADRYETSVAIARNGFATPSSGIVIVSGEKESDALAAAPLAGTSMPILLVKKDSLPASVADYLDDVKSTIKSTNPYKIYIVGGTSVVSTDVEDAIKAIVTPGDATPATITRYSGDDRYATALDLAKRHPGLMDNLDRLVIVNGTGWADAMSVAPIAAKKGWPIALTGDGGLNATAKAFVDAYMAVPGSAKKFLLVGGSSVLPTSIEEYLVGTKLVSPANIDRRGGADRYDTNLAMQVYALPTASGGYNAASSFDGKYVAIASGTSPWDALSASSWAAKGNTNSYHVLLSNPVAPSANVLGVMGLVADLTKGGTSANSWPNTLFVLGGKNAVADTVKAGAIAAAQSTDIPAPTFSGCIDGAGTSAGSSTLSLTFAKNLTTNEKAEFTSLDTSVRAAFKLNGVKDSSTSFINGIAFSTGSSKVINLTLAAALDPADTVDFAGIVEGTATSGGSHANWTRSIGAATQCVVALDSSAPSITVKAVPKNGGIDHILVTSNEALDQTALTTVGNWTIGSATASGTLTATALDATSTTYKITDGNANGLSATQVVTLAAAGIKDRANTANISAASVAAAAAADATAPTLTLAAKSCSPSAQAANTAGGLTFTAVSYLAGGGVDGTAGNGYAISVVNSRGLIVPSVSVDSAAKTITVLADTGYHTIADIKKVAENAGIDGNWSISGTDANKPTATIVPATTLSGADTCTLTIVGSEPFVLDASDDAATAGGIPGSATIAAITIVNAAGSGAATVNAVTITVTQAGTIVYQADTSDVYGNELTRIVSA